MIHHYSTIQKLRFNQKKEVIHTGTRDNGCYSTNTQTILRKKNITFPMQQIGMPGLLHPINPKLHGTLRKRGVGQANIDSNVAHS